MSDVLILQLGAAAGPGDRSGSSAARNGGVAIRPSKPVDMLDGQPARPRRPTHSVNPASNPTLYIAQGQHGQPAASVTEAYDAHLNEVLHNSKHHTSGREYMAYVAHGRSCHPRTTPYPSCDTARVLPQCQPRTTLVPTSCHVLTLVALIVAPSKNLKEPLSCRL